MTGIAHSAACPTQTTGIFGSNLGIDLEFKNIVILKLDRI